METKINEFMSSTDSQKIYYNKDIVMKDLEGNTKTVVKCYCTIVAGQSISYYMDVVEKEIFREHKADIQPEITKFKREAERIAIEHDVPII